MSRRTRIVWLIVLAVLTGAAWAAARAVNRQVAAWLAVPEEDPDEQARKVAARNRTKAAKKGAADARTPDAPVPGAPPPGGEAPLEPPLPPGEPGGSPDAETPVVADVEEDDEPVAGGGLESYTRPIVARSLFDSSKVGAEVASAEGEEGEGGGVQVSDLQAELLGTLMARDPEYSTALLKLSGNLGIYRTGDRIEDATVALIDRRRIEIVRGNGTREVIVIGGTPGSKTETVASRPSPEGGGKHTWDGIRDLGNNRYQIDPSELQYAMSNLEKLSREARVVPNYENGKNNGFKVFGIKRDGVFKKLGIKNNDVLTSINGQPLTADKALDLYSKLGSARNLSVDIIRRGEAMTLDYEVK